jgi:hypothetical protein
LDRLALLDRGLAEPRFVSSFFQSLAHHLKKWKGVQIQKFVPLIDWRLLRKLIFTQHDTV